MKADTSGPISFFLNLTDRCPLNCVHCSAKGRKKDQELNTTQWKDLISQIQKMGTSIIGFTGGEPLLRNDLEEIISYVSPLSKTLLFTCGQTLDRDRAGKLKQAGLFGAAISLDSANPGEHDERRGKKGSFNSAIMAVKHCKQAGLYTMIQTVVLKKDLNQKHFFSICRLARNLGVQEIRVLEPIKSGNFFKDSPDIFYTLEDRKKLIKLHHKANSIPGFPKISTFAHTESDDKYGCGAGIQHSYINSNGDLYPCDFVPINFGNIKNQALKTIWDQMKQTFSRPHSGCFAMKNFKNIEEKSRKKGLPLSKEEGIEICSACVPKDYPKYYRILQGRK